MRTTIDDLRELRSTGIQLAGMLIIALGFIWLVSTIFERNEFNACKDQLIVVEPKIGEVYKCPLSTQTMTLTPSENRYNIVCSCPKNFSRIHY